MDALVLNERHLEMLDALIDEVRQEPAFIQTLVDRAKGADDVLDFCVLVAAGACCEYMMAHNIEGPRLLDALNDPINARKLNYVANASVEELLRVRDRVRRQMRQQAA